MSEIKILKVLEFEDFFPDEKDFNIEETLKQYNRADLMRAPVIMSCNYGDAWFNDPRKPFFSFPNSPYIKEVENRWIKLCSKEGIKYSEQIPFFMFRTAMELLRILYSIPESEFRNNQDEYKEEYDLFKCILAINTRILACNTNGATTIAELVYFNMYITNEMSNFDISTAMRTQFIYADSLFYELSSNAKCESLYKKYLERWGIKDWREYTNGLNALVCQLYLMQKNNGKGTPVIDTEKIKSENGLLNKKFIDLLSIDISDNIAYLYNVDYKCFRERPLLRIGSHRYIPLSTQLLMEKIYNSIYFDLMSLYGGECVVDNLSFAEFYKKYLFEKHVFQHLMLKSVKGEYIVYPSKDIIMSEEPTREDDSQPDFYIHEGRHVILFECKAVKLNGDLRDSACYNELKHDLRVKFYNKKENLDGSSNKHKNIGITQLTNFISLSESGKYEWDKPKNVIYYPVLVLEDPKIIKPGLTCMMNNWYMESLGEKSDLQKYRPLIVLSVDTISLYAEFFKEQGFVYYFEMFYRENVKHKSMDEWRISDTADFNEFMKRTCKGPLNFDVEKFIRG